jgi:hypothetical protein
MFPTSVMQKNEEDLLNKVDEYCNEYFLKRLREPNLEHSLSGSENVQSGATLERIENLQAYLLQLQESQSVVAQQMTQVASQFTQIMENTSIEEQADQH